MQPLFKLIVYLLFLCGGLFCLHLLLNLLLPLVGAPLAVKPLVIALAGLAGVWWCFKLSGVLSGPGA